MWDFGGVFSPSPFTAVSNLGREKGYDVDRFFAAVFGSYDVDGDHPWHRLERGEIDFMTARESIMESARADGMEADPIELFTRMGQEGGGMRAEVVEMATAVKDRGFQTAIVTNKPERHAIHLMDAWSDRLPMDVVLGEIEGRPRKPDPAMLLEARKQCGAETAWMVGDSEVDGHAARAMGADFIGVRLGYNHGRDIAEMDPRPDQVFDELGSFLSWIESL